MPRWSDLVALATGATGATANGRAAGGQAAGVQTAGARAVVADADARAADRWPAPEQRRPVLAFRDVHHAFDVGGTSPFRAVEHVSLTVQTGELVSLVGPSGCGKSTLLRLAAGLADPTAGQVRVLGGTPAEARARHAIGVVFQEPALLPWRSALGNVMLAGEVAGLDRRRQEARARGALETVGLAGFEDFLPAQLSGGMKQRTAIARALLLDPQLLLLDEPFGALDHITRERLQADFSAAWVDATVAGVLVTHDVGEAVFMSDRIAVLTDRPARLAGIVDIPEPRPRDEAFRSSAAFFEYCCVTRAILQHASAGSL